MTILILFQFVCIPIVHCATLELSSFLLLRKVDEVPGHQEMTWRHVSSEKSLWLFVDIEGYTTPW